MGGPEAEGIGSARRQEEVKGITGGDLVQDFGAIYGLGPEFDGGQLDGVGLGLEVKFGAVFGDFGVEGFDAEVEAFGFGASGAVVLGGGELGEAIERRYIVELLHRYIVGKGGLRERRGPRMVEGWRVDG